jgi:hypothetical protein
MLAYLVRAQGVWSRATAGRRSPDAQNEHVSVISAAVRRLTIPLARLCLQWQLQVVLTSSLEIRGLAA